MIVVIFIGLGRAYKFGGRDFEVILWGGMLQIDGEIFMGEVHPSRHYVVVKGCLHAIKSY